MRDYRKVIIYQHCLYEYVRPALRNNGKHWLFLSLSRVYDVTAPCLAKLRNGSVADTKHDIKKYNPAWVTTNLSKRHSVLSGGPWNSKMVVEKLTDVCASEWLSDSTNDVVMLSSNFTNPKANFTAIFYLFTVYPISANVHNIWHLIKVICSLLFRPDPLWLDSPFLPTLKNSSSIYWP